MTETSDPPAGDGLQLVHDVARPALDVRDEMMTLAALAGMEVKALAGFALIAWTAEGRPAVYCGLDGPTNPVRPYLLPAFAQAAAQDWLRLAEAGPTTPAC